MSRGTPSSTMNFVFHLRSLRSTLAFAWPVAAMMSMASCGLLPGTARPTAIEVRSQTLANGFLVALSSDRPVGPVSAFVTRGRWLIVTVVDSLVSFDEDRFSRPSFVDSVEVSRFPTSLQLALHLTVNVSDVEVVQDPGSSDVWISLFAARKERRKP